MRSAGQLSIAEIGVEQSTNLQLCLAEGRSRSRHAVSRQLRRREVLPARLGCLGNRQRRGHQRHLAVMQHVNLEQNCQLHHPLRHGVQWHRPIMEAQCAGAADRKWSPTSCAACGSVSNPIRYQYCKNNNECGMTHQQRVMRQRERLHVTPVLLRAVSAVRQPVRRPKVHRLRAVEPCSTTACRLPDQWRLKRAVANVSPLAFRTLWSRGATLLQYHGRLIDVHRC